MQFNTAFIAAAIVALTAAAPATGDISHEHVNAALQHLDSQGNVNWKEVDGGRVASVSNADLISAHAQLQAQPKPKSLNRRFDFSSSVGQISGLAVKSACEGENGDRMSASTAGGFVTQACSALLGEIPGAQAANKAWQFFQTTSTDNKGDKNWINFRFQYRSKTAPTLTQEICSQGLDQITKAVCVQASDGTTSGATLEIGGGDGIWLGFDPNTDNKLH